MELSNPQDRAVDTVNGEIKKKYVRVGESPEIERIQRKASRFFDRFIRGVQRPKSITTSILGRPNMVFYLS